MHAAKILNFFEIKQGYPFIFFFNLLISLYLKKKKNSESYLKNKGMSPVRLSLDIFLSENLEVSEKVYIFAK